MLLALVWLLAGSVAAMVLAQRRNPLSRPAFVAWIGLDISLVGIILTPGIVWGEVDDESAVRPISTIVFYVGVGVMIWAAVLWRRSRRQHHAASN